MAEQPTTDPHLPPSSEPEANDGSETPEAPEEARVTVKGLFDELLTPTNLTIIGLAALLGGVGLLGGWEQVREKETELKVAEPLKEEAAEPIKVIFDKAYWYTGAVSLPYVGEGSRGLMVTATVTNTSKYPVNSEILGKMFRIEASGLTVLGEMAPADKTPPEMYRASDLLPFNMLQPGLPTKLVLIWQQQEQEPPPTSLKIITYKQTLKTSSLTGKREYLDPEPKLTATLPAKEFTLP